MNSRRFLAGIGLVAMLGGVGACQRRMADAPVAPTPSERASATPMPTAATAKVAAPRPATETTKEVSDEPPRTPAQLQAAYLTAKEFPDKVEIIYDLGNLDTAEAIQTLMRLFEAESDVDLQQEMIDATERMEEQIPAKLAFLAIALRPSQPPDIRDTAVGLLLTIDDRRAIPIWQLLLKDADPERREMAQERIEDLQQTPLD